LENSLSAYPVQEGLIILRSIGKFFGLAGIRCGFVISTPELLNKLNEDLGPWTISHPARYVANAALQDRLWQQQNRDSLPLQAQRLHQLLSAYGLQPDGGSDLFQWIKTEQASTIHHFLATRGILTRLFTHPSSLRFGLPKSEEQWVSLEEALILLRRR
jgi:cobalamin biosynthetic protein CobC